MNFFQLINDYGKMVKFSHTIFALPFAGLSLILALESTQHNKDTILRLIGLIILCMISARSAAMGFNRYADRDIDALNPRTKNREIPAGKISANAVLFFVILSSIVFIGSCYFINSLSFYLSFPALFLILFYSLSKRFTFFCHYILGLAIGIAPTGAWVALTDTISILPLLWSFGLMLHIAGFDLLYASQDVDFDRANHLHSIPARFGITKAFWIARITHVFSFSLFVYAGFYAQLSWIYFTFLGIVGILFIIEHYLARPDDLSRIPIAFFNVNAAISIVLFLGTLIDRRELILKLF